MALVLEPSLRQEILRRRRQTPDKRIAQRLGAILWIADGRTSREVADLLGVNPRQIRKWLRLFRTQGLETLGTLHYQGGTGRLRPAHIERLKQTVATGRFLAARQIADGVAQTFHVAYTDRGIRNLLHRIGASYHRATGFFWKADPDKQEEFVHKYEQQKKEADGQKTRLYFVDACHPVWGVEMLYYCSSSRQSAARAPCPVARKSPATPPTLFPPVWSR